MSKPEINLSKAPTEIILSKSKKRIWIEIAQIAFPSIGISFIGILQETLNIVIVALMQDNIQQDAVGLGNTIISLAGIAVFTGLNNALNTFSSQAFGANRIELCGVYLWRARIVFVGGYIICSPIFIFSRQILIALGQDKIASKYASYYIWAYMPGLIM